MAMRQIRFIFDMTHVWGETAQGNWQMRITEIDTDHASNRGVWRMGVTASSEDQQSLNAGETDNDTLDGGAGADDLFGGTGDDTLTRASLFANDLNFGGDALQLRSFGDAIGGSVAQNGNGDIVFTPTAGYAGVMSFTYTNQNSYGHFTASQNGVSADLKATVTLRTPDKPTDPLFAEQRYLNDGKVVPVWKDYTGKGVRIGQFEPDAPFQTDTTTFDYRHSDLQANADANWLASGAAPTGFSNHATLVAGVMVAARDGGNDGKSALAGRRVERYLFGRE